MDQNQVEIELLKKDPGKLVAKYQQVIWTIVRNYLNKGMVRYREQEDLVQEVNKKLLERIPRIQAQYNNTSKLRTYLSVIIRNMCLEEYRRIDLISEPESPLYKVAEASEKPVDSLLYKQEYERLQRILIIFGKERARLNLLLKVLNNILVENNDLILFGGEKSEDDLNRIGILVNTCQDQMKKRKFEILSQVISEFEDKDVPPDSLRKWYSSRLTECLKLLNGDPPSCSYSADTLGLLLERISYNENS